MSRYQTANYSDFSFDVENTEANMNIRKHWGLENGQTVAVPKDNKDFIYARGYDQHGEKVKLYIADEDVMSFVMAVLDVQERKK